MADVVLAAPDSCYFFTYEVFLAAFVPPFVFCLRFLAGIFVYSGLVIFETTSNLIYFYFIISISEII